jgi:Malectin domain
VQHIPRAMNQPKLTKLVALVVGLALNLSSAAGQSVIWAVNAGGEAMIGAHGIAYQKDINDEGLTQHFGENITIGRVVADDADLFRSARFDPTKFGYRIPLIGNGDYLLALKFAENDEDVQSDGRLIDVVLNKHHQVCNGLDIFKMAGRYNAHFEYVHFKIMGNRLIYKSEVSKITDGGGVRLDFFKNKGEPFVSAIVLYSGDVEAVKHNLNPALVSIAI